jgi:hypothetical protein
MDCYKVLSPSLEALFAIGSLRPFRLRLRSDSDPAPVQQLATYKCRSNLSQVFSPKRSNPQNNEVNKPISCHTDRVSGLHA